MPLRIAALVVCIASSEACTRPGAQQTTDPFPQQDGVVRLLLQ